MAKRNGQCDQYRTVDKSESLAINRLEIVRSENCQAGARLVDFHKCACARRFGAAFDIRVP